MAGIVANMFFPENVEQGLYTLTDDDISRQIGLTHIRHNVKLDTESLFTVVETILNRATQIADKVLGGTEEKNLEEKIAKPSFTLPLCKLRKISCEMQCQDLGDQQIVRKTVESILNTLSGYSLEKMAVLTLAAFALDYGEFWILFQQNESLDEVTKSLSILRGVPLLLKSSPSWVKKHNRTLQNLNEIIKNTLEVIEIIFTLEKKYHVKTSTLEKQAHWAIVTVVASTIQFRCLINDKDKTKELDTFYRKLRDDILNNLRMLKLQHEQLEEEEEAYLKLEKHFKHPTEVMDVIEELIYAATKNKHELFDGFTKKLVTFEVLRSKNVLLLISGLDISDDILILKHIHDHNLFKKDQYKIVWVPIVEQWTDKPQKDFETVRNDMPWYIVPYFSSRVCTRYVKEKWQYKNNPIIVVLNPQGGVECEDAIHMIRLWRMKAFPFTREVEITLSRGSDWFGCIATGLDTQTERWIGEGKYTFFYGGYDGEWTQDFEGSAKKLVDDHIKLFRVEKGGIFWKKIDSLFISNTQSKTEKDDVLVEIKKLISFKNENGWVVLSKGSDVSFMAHGTTALKVFRKVEAWSKLIVVPKNPLEKILIEEHTKEEKISISHPCCRIDIPSDYEKVPESFGCPYCTRVMVKYTSMKCCHGDGVANGHH